MVTSTVPVTPHDHEPDSKDPLHKRQQNSFAAEALKLGGKAEEEIRRTGALDTADDDVEAMFAARYQTINSPIHLAVWGKKVPADLFGFPKSPAIPSEMASLAIRRSLNVVKRHHENKTIFDSQRKISTQVMDELGHAGYWGLLIGPEYGGSGAPFSQFAPMLTQMATVDPTVAGLGSVHGCIGAVDPLLAFGNAEQKARLLPKLASGERLSAFALTEPCAGSDLTALRTTAVRNGDDYVLNGEKLFITNVLPGRMIGVVCLIDDVPAVLIAELPPQEDETFQLKRYGLYALQHAHNYGIVFKNFRVPASNRLVPEDGDGLTIAYHGLNRGRVALCAGAAGTMRLMMSDMLPWARFRRTYGAAIESRELVRRRVGHLAGLIVACDALTEWCAGLLDQGYRGEMECVIAKIFGSEAQKEAAIELHMKTHGGRSFLSGHLFGDNIHDFLAPCIYEGEGEVLGMSFFKSLVKHHGRTYFEPIGKALAAHQIKNPNMANPAHAWALRKPLWDYSKWWMAQKLHRSAKPELPSMPAELRQHAEFAADFLQRSSMELSSAMRKHQLKLADRQCRMAELSARVQTAVVILCTSLYGARQENSVRLAAEGICTALTDRLLGRRPKDRYYSKVTKLGATISEIGFPGVSTTSPTGILMKYAQ